MSDYAELEIGLHRRDVTHFVTHSGTSSMKKFALSGT